MIIDAHVHFTPPELAASLPAFIAAEPYWGLLMGGSSSPQGWASAERMIEDMDIDCGPIIDGTATVQDKGREIFETILRVAGGEASKSEALGIGDDEFVPWTVGAVM